MPGILRWNQRRRHDCGCIAECVYVTRTGAVITVLRGIRARIGVIGLCDGLGYAIILGLRQAVVDARHTALGDVDERQQYAEQDMD